MPEAASEASILDVVIQPAAILSDAVNICSKFYTMMMAVNIEMDNSAARELETRNLKPWHGAGEYHRELHYA
jgi:chloramphenicol 3-O-phosphotransferase